MTALRPSLFNRPPRPDGGPFLIIVPRDWEEDPCYYVDVLFTDIPESERDKNYNFPYALLMTVSPDHLEIHPIHVRQDKHNYLQPKYGNLKKIMFTKKVAGPYELPKTLDDVEALLEALPDGFAKDYRFGLGLLWEYRQICETISNIPEVDTLYIHGSDEVKITDPFYSLGVNHFHELRTQLKRIAGRYQREARQEKEVTVYNALNHAADSTRFPKKSKKLRKDILTEITQKGQLSLELSKSDRKAAIKLVKSNVETLAQNESKILLDLKNDIERVTLVDLIVRFEKMISDNLSEARWQTFFKENPFILSLALAIPYSMIGERAYAGGKGVDGRGGKYTDFLMAAATSGNLALIEIKTPGTDLLDKKVYRGRDVFSVSWELGGAITQVLAQRHALHNELPIMKHQQNRSDIHDFSINCYIIVGMSPSTHEQKKSFELIRNASTAVVIITFDELLKRMQLLLSVLSPGPEAEISNSTRPADIDDLF